MGEQYVGVKFKVTHLPAERISDSRIDELIEIGQKLAAKGFCPENCGNLSFRYEASFVITRAGCEIGKLSPMDFVRVPDVDLVKKRVSVAGSLDPSSEAMMHFMIYAARPDVNVILHAHCLDLKNAITTKTAYPYSTLECANSAVEVLRNHDLVILKDHGFVSVGKDCADAFQKIR